MRSQPSHHVQKKESGPTLGTSADAARGTWLSLVSDARAFMEPRFGHDFSKVRVHTSTAAPGGANPVAGAPVVQQAPGGERVQRQPKQPSSPQDEATVKRAKDRLTVLEPLLGRLQGRKVAVEADRLRTLADRRRLDDNAADPFMPI